MRAHALFHGVERETRDPERVRSEAAAKEVGRARVHIGRVTFERALNQLVREEPVSRAEFSSDRISSRIPGRGAQAPYERTWCPYDS